MKEPTPMKKVVILGGGTGQSTLLRGLKEFPIDISAVVSVCDDGRSLARGYRQWGCFAGRRCLDPAGDGTLVCQSR